jgi:fucose 4-O-acetylase-like acetyltransferase
LQVAVVVSLVSGAFTGDTLDLARALGLLPFFVVGLLVTPEQLAVVRHPAARVYAVGAFALALLAAAVVESVPGSTELLYWRSSYDELGVSLTLGVVERLVLIGAAGALAVAFMTLLPRRTLWCTPLGAASLVVYLFHGFVVALVLCSAFPGWTADHATLGLLVTTVAAVGLALLLAAPPVARRLDVVVDPVGSWQRRRRRQAAPAGATPRRQVGEMEQRGTLSSTRATGTLGA